MVFLINFFYLLSRFSLGWWWMKCVCFYDWTPNFWGIEVWKLDLGSQRRPENVEISSDLKSDVIFEVLIIEQKMRRIKRGVSGWFSNFVQTRTNSSKLEPVVVSFWKVYQKNYFFMLSNFCFMNFFDLTGHNGAIEARKTSQVSRKSPSSSVIWPRIKKCHSSKGV